MKTLTERMNTQIGQVNGAHVMSKTYLGFAAYDTLCLICAELDIDLSEIEDSDFYSCSLVLEWAVWAANKNAGGDCGKFSVWFD